MSKKDKDKIATQKNLKPAETDDPVLAEQDNSQELDSPTDAHKEAAADPINTAPGTPANSNDAQTVAETPENANDINEAVAENNSDEQKAMNSQAATADEGAVDNKDEKRVSEDSSADEDTHTAQEPAPKTDGHDEPTDSERLDQNLSQTDKSVDDRLGADAEPDEDLTTEGEAGNENEAPQSEDKPAEENTDRMQDSSQTENDQSLDVVAKDPNASLSPEAVDDDSSVDKEMDPVLENKESRSPAAGSDDKGDDDSAADAESVDTSEPAAAKSAFKEEDEDSAEEEPNDTVDDDTPQDRLEQEPNDTEEGTEDLPELEPKKKIPLIKAALTLIMVVAVFSGFFIFDNKSNNKLAQKTKSKEVSKALSAKASQKNLKPAIQPDDPNYIYYVKIDEISALREMLLHKKEEILELKNHYQAGIEELEKEILDELRHPANVTFLQAIENKRIEFGLRTIQRRLAYIQQLDLPAEWAFQAGEDLLFIKRKALMDIKVSEVASGIDMNMHVRHMNTALNKYRPTADKLAIDMTEAPSESLESIWQRIQNKGLAHSSQLAYSKNQIIFEQICAGDFSRLAELSDISVDSAKCIVEMQGSDLFLNGLTEISPSAARHLFQWKGNWICLNGFRALSPRVAAYLFEWEGSWISLNGLTDFPPEIGNMLLQWEGNQLELMGLRYSDGSAGKIGIKYLAQWELSGGKLFVPKTIRKIIDEINANQRPSA